MRHFNIVTGPEKLVSQDLRSKLVATITFENSVTLRCLSGDRPRDPLSVDFPPLQTNLALLDPGVPQG